jgi:hypothetical protein
MSEPAIPGTGVRSGRGYLYLQSPNAARFRELFPRITKSGDGPLPKTGGAINEEVCLAIPTGETFWAISFKGDLEGWRSKILGCAEAEELLWAEISGDDFLVSDGRSVSVGSCRVERM